MTAEEMKAARALIKWSQLELALNAKVASNTVANIEAGRSRGRASILNKLRGALEVAGIEFTAQKGEGLGVRLRKTGE